MSCLSKNHRIHSESQFKEIYKKGKRWHCHSFVTYFLSSDKIALAFVASKKIGTSVQRNKVKRRLRAIFLNISKETKLKIGKYVFVCKTEINEHDFETLSKNMIWSLKKLHSEKNNTSSN